MTPTRLRRWAGVALGAAIAIVSTRSMHDYWRYVLLERVHHTSQEDIVYFLGMLAWSFGGAGLGGFTAGLIGGDRGARLGALVNLVVLAIAAIVFGPHVDASATGTWTADFARPWHRNQTFWTLLGFLAGGPIGGLAGERVSRGIAMAWARHRGGP